jgi:hypothetical protein
MQVLVELFKVDLHLDALSLDILLLLALDDALAGDA